jgi:hypothetical protein
MYGIGRISDKYKNHQVKWAKTKKGKITVEKFGTLAKAESRLAAIRKKGWNGIIVKESVELGERSVAQSDAETKDAQWMMNVKKGKKKGIRDFKVGDKVKVVDDAPFSTHKIGDIGKITKLSGSGMREIATVKLQNGKTIRVMSKLDIIKESVELDEEENMVLKTKQEILDIQKKIEDLKTAHATRMDAIKAKGSSNFEKSQSDMEAKRNGATKRKEDAQRKIDAAKKRIEGLRKKMKSEAYMAPSKKPSSTKELVKMFTNPSASGNLGLITLVVVKGGKEVARKEDLKRNEVKSAIKACQKKYKGAKIVVKDHMDRLVGTIIEGRIIQFTKEEIEHFESVTAISMKRELVNWIKSNKKKFKSPMDAIKKAAEEFGIENEIKNKNHWIWELFKKK